MNTNTTAACLAGYQPKVGKAGSPEKVIRFRVKGGQEVTKVVGPNGVWSRLIIYKDDIFSIFFQQLKDVIFMDGRGESSYIRQVRDELS